MKLSTRFLIVPFVLAAFSYLFYSAYKDVKDRTLNDFKKQQFILAKQASRGIESFFIYYQRELNFLSSLSYVSDLTGEGRKLLADFYKNHSDQIEGITVVDSVGILIYTYPENENALGRDISTQAHVKTVIETQKPIVSDVFTSLQGFKTIAYHVPMLINNVYQGSIAILIPVDKLGKRFVENIRTGETGYGWLVNESGIKLFNPLGNYTGRSVNETFKNYPSVLDLYDKTLKNTEGSAICYIPDPQKDNGDELKVQSAFYRISFGNTFWTIIIFSPEEEIYAKLTSFRNRLYILILLVIVVISVYFYLSFKASNILKEEKRRKAIEKTLIESEKRFRVMFELSPAGIILIDENGKIIEVNTSFSETLGYTRGEIIGKNIRTFAAPQNDGEIEENISNILSGKTIIHEVKNTKKDGTTCDVALYETLIVLPDGKPGILSVSNDITEKKRSQKRMLTLSRALESIGECVSITDYHNKVIFVNNELCKTYGYTDEEIIGKDIGIIRVPKSEYLSEKILEDTINGGWNGELINRKKDGTEFPIELSTSHIKDENGKPIALIGIASDITERKRVRLELVNAKEKAEESDRLKSAFLANISHELRTPLNAIIGFSGLIMESGPDENTLPYSKIILTSGQHLLSMVEDIFDSTMIETGQIRMNYEKADIVPIMEDVRDMMQGERLREEKSEVALSLNLNVAARNIPLITDTRKLKQVLINLLRNALKFTDRGDIEFGFSEITENGKSFLKFYVRDTGIGIDKSHHETIFNIFRQIDDTHTRKFGGLGIGLSIAKKTVEHMGGRIWVESEHKKGSIFYFTIPVAPDKYDDKIESKHKTSGMEKLYSGKTVLIAEDERSNFEFLNILLTRINIRVLWAQNGMEAVNFCEIDPSINLVLMDIKMPLMNGLDATKLIKSKRPHLPVIAQSAYAMNSDIKEAKLAGCDEYLSKPIKISQVTDLVEKYL
jgi:PAS domain S-box-containing protein